MTLTVETDVQGIAVSAVRVFMERVEGRIAREEAATYYVAMTQELAEMEKE
jgi:limonene-1,2-epoxide hydrolase